MQKRPCWPATAAWSAVLLCFELIPLQQQAMKQAIKPKLARAGSLKEFFTEERCHILEISNSSSDEGLSIARARVEPGVTTALHRVIDTVERYIILSGSGRVEVEGLEPSDVGPYDVVIIPKGASHSVFNVHDGTTVWLYGYD